MNVFEQDIISQFQIAIGFDNDNNGEDQSGYAGVMETVFSNDYFSPDGSVSSIGLTDSLPIGATDQDQYSDVQYGTDIWLGFWNPNT
jgi:hypothetical protein